MLAVQVITFFTLWLILAFFIRPLNRLTRAAERIANGQLEQQIEIDSDDEIGQPGPGLQPDDPGDLQGPREGDREGQPPGGRRQGDHPAALHQRQRADGHFDPAIRRRHPAGLGGAGGDHHLGGDRGDRPAGRRERPAGGGAGGAGEPGEQRRHAGGCRCGGGHGGAAGPRCSPLPRRCWSWAKTPRRSAASSTSSTKFPTRPTCWHSTPPSRRPGPGRPGSASPSSPARSSAWRSAPSPPPARSRPWSRQIQQATNETIMLTEEGSQGGGRGQRPGRPRLGRPGHHPHHGRGDDRRRKEIKLSTQQQTTASEQMAETIIEVRDVAHPGGGGRRGDVPGDRRPDRPGRKVAQHPGDGPAGEGKIKAASGAQDDGEDPRTKPCKAGRFTAGGAVRRELRADPRHRPARSTIPGTTPTSTRPSRGWRTASWRTTRWSSRSSPTATATSRPTTADTASR